MSAAGLLAGHRSSVAARLEDAARTVAYVAVGLPLGAAYLACLAVGVAVGAALSPLWVGLPILLAVVAAAVRVAELERRLANELLQARIPPLPRRRDGQRRAYRRLLDQITALATWRAVAVLVLKLPMALAATVVVAAPAALCGALVVLGLEGLFDPTVPQRFIGPWHLETALGLVLLALAVPAAIVSVAVLEGVRGLLRAALRLLLVTPAPPGGEVREALAESLGDRSLGIAYWLPERGAFVDEHGHRVELPDRSTGRSWTVVEHEGRRVAAIIHDAELDAGPEIVQAAAAGAVLALENEALKADLRARLEELRASRARIVQAGDAARRRIERDLHDGAQQHLVALSLDLQLIRRRVADDDAATTLVNSSIEKLATALEELRELARGIHPAVLADRGLEPALTALADRAPLPVDLDVALERRPSPSIEAAAYFVVAEALTNVAKYAAATRAEVSVRAVDGHVEVEVRDDGAGGADPAAGSGLRGLEDRVAALDGVLRVVSVPGEGTRVLASIPTPVVD